MEQSEVSTHQLRVFQCLARAHPRQWMTNKAIACATGVSLRNVSLHTRRLVDLGIFDQAEVFPGHRFRLSEKADKRNAAYMIRLKQAEDIFGMLVSKGQGIE